MNDDINNEQFAPADSVPEEPVTPEDVVVDCVFDARLYLPDHEEWDVKIKRDSDRIYCYSKHPGEDWFHLILNGEIYVIRQHEKYCLRCALRMNVLTQDRLFWQRRIPKRQNNVL